jgi:hypothetical protein
MVGFVQRANDIRSRIFTLWSTRYGTMVVPFTSLEYLRGSDATNWYFSPCMLLRPCKSLIYELIQLMRQPRALRSGSCTAPAPAAPAAAVRAARGNKRSSAPATNVLLVPVDLLAV